MAYSCTPQPWVSIDDFPSTDDLDTDLVSLVEGWIVEFAGDLEARANRVLSCIVVDERCEVFGDLIQTRQRPVQSVEEVSFTGVTGFDTDVSSGNIRMVGFTPSLLSTDPYALVSYTAAFPDETLAAARNLVIERARRRLSREVDDAVGTDSVSEEGYSAQLIPEGWTETELAFIESIRRRVGA